MKETGGFEGSSKNEMGKKLKCVKKMFTGKSLVLDFKTLALASLIKSDVVVEEILPAKQRNISSLHKITNRNHSIDQKYIKNKFIKNQDR